jgi:hypothetical protein
MPASNAGQNLEADKGFTFVDKNEGAPKGFQKPVRLY